MNRKAFRKAKLPKLEKVLEMSDGLTWSVLGQFQQSSTFVKVLSFVFLFFPELEAS